MGNHRIGSASTTLPHHSTLANKENVAPQQQPSGKQVRSRQGVLASLAASPRRAGRALQRMLHINRPAEPVKPQVARPVAQVRPPVQQPPMANAAVRREVAGPARSVRTPGHGVSGGNTSVQHHRARVLSQIEHLPTEHGKQAWRKPIEAMETLDRHVAHLPPAQSVKLLQQMQVILSIKDSHTRNLNLDHFVASLKPAAVHARPSGGMSSPAPRPSAPRPAAATPNRPAATPTKLSFKDLEDFASQRPRSAAQAQSTPARRPQAGRPASAPATPARAHTAPTRTLADFERDAEEAAAYHGHAHADYSAARAEYASYLARSNPAPERRSQSAPPRLQRAAPSKLDHVQRAQIARAEDERARYHGEMPNYQQAYADHAARQPTPAAVGLRRAARPAPRQLSASELQSIHQAEDQRAEYHSESPDYAGAEAAYRAQHGL
ncbi:hypothetical protein R8510_01445 [Ralstonia chuxiongensis]|nr:hypothetical protein R8510_01445 [Ralstonia chuxiongensis]